MDIFSSLISQMLMMAVFIIIGFLLNKKKILPPNADTVLSKLQLNIFLSAQLLYAMMTGCTVETFQNDASLILQGTVIFVCSILLSYPLAALIVSRKKNPKDLRYRRAVMKYALSVGNFTFFGNFIVESLWGSEVLARYLLFSFGLNVLCCGWGMFILAPKKEGDSPIKKILKSLLIAPIIAMVLGIVMGLSGATQYVPEFFMTVLKNSSACVGPVAMIIAGFVIAKYNIKDLLTSKKAYVATALRLVILPTLILLVLSALHFSKEILSFALFAFASPIVLNIIIFPATFGGDTRDSAAMVLVSTIFSIITIPLMYLIFIG